MTKPENGQPKFEIHASKLTQSDVFHLHHEADERGQGHEFIAAFRKICEHLESRPLEFGEPLYRLPELGLQVRQGAIYPVVVSYGVSEQRTIVYIQVVKLLS